MIDQSDLAQRLDTSSRRLAALLARAPRGPADSERGAARASAELLREAVADLQVELRDIGRLASFIDDLIAELDRRT